MHFIDTHSHLYLPQFDDDRQATVARMIAEGVKKVYLPAIDSKTHAAMLALEAENPGVCVAMMGLHPCSVTTETVEAELQLIFDYWQTRDFCAVGEIGLDLYWDKTTLNVQQFAFEQQIEWAKEKNRPIIIHARESMHEILPIVRKHKTERLHGIFHCYSGTLEQARACIDLGFYLGIGGVLTYKKSGLADIMREISLQHLVLETDAPYLPPVPHRGKRNESSYIPLIAQYLAEVKNCSLAEIAEVTSENARRCFGSF